MMDDELKDPFLADDGDGTATDDAAVVDEPEEDAAPVWEEDDE